MKCFPTLLAIVLPCAVGWWGGSVFWPVEEKPGVRRPVIPAREEAPSLTAVLENKTPRERMAGLARLGRQDPLALLAGLRAQSEATDATRDAARALALHSPEAAWRFLRAAWSDDASLRASCEDAAAWACERNPAAGLAFLARLAKAAPDGLGEETASALVKKSLEGFARQDLPVFREWLTRQPEGALRQQVLVAILPRWVAEDFPAALAAIQAMPREDEGLNLRFWSLFNNVVKGGSEPLSGEEQDRRLAMLAPEDREALLPQLILDRGLSDPDAALTQLAQLAGETLTNSTQSLFTRWAERDPLRASRNVATLPESSQPGAAAAVAHEWARKNGAAASSWVATLPDGIAREAAAGSLSAALAPNYPQEALMWAASLTGESARADALLNAWRASSKEDPAAALAALEAADLSPADQQRLRAVNP